MSTIKGRIASWIHSLFKPLPPPTPIRNSCLSSGLYPSFQSVIWANKDTLQRWLKVLPRPTSPEEEEVILFIHARLQVLAKIERKT